MEHRQILELLNFNYTYGFDKIEFHRDGGSLSYVVWSEKDKYFLRIIRPQLVKIALQSADIHVYLLENRFSVPRIIFTNQHQPYVIANEPDGKHVYILYAYIEGGEPDRNADMEGIGELVGRFHKIMKNYKGCLPTYDKYFFVDRYVEILGKMKYPISKINAYKKHGDALWERVKGLPCGFSHCDLYIGNIHKTPSGEMYVLDFDTSCYAFPAYDIVLPCNATDYFHFEESAYAETHKFIERFLKGYCIHNPVTPGEIEAFDDLIAIYHYQLQANIIEIYGLNCVDNDFLDRQYDWLMKWERI